MPNIFYLFFVIVTFILMTNCICSTFYPMPFRIEPIRELQTRCIPCGTQRLVFHEKILTMLAASIFPTKTETSTTVKTFHSKKLSEALFYTS